MDELISVILSTYNESLYEVKRCITSIIEQSYKEIEVIVICDNPDNSIVIDYLQSIRDDRIRVYYNQKNRGLVYCLNYGLSLAHGSFIARVDADDYCIGDRFRKQLNYLNENKLDLIGSWIKLINENGVVIGDMIFPTSNSDIRSKIKKMSCIAHPTWFGRKKIFDDIGGYRNIDYCEDYDFLLRIISKGYKVGNIPEYCLCYQVRKKSISGGHHAEQMIRTRYLARLSKSELEDLTTITQFFNSKRYWRDVNRFEKYTEHMTYFRQGKVNHIIFAFVNINLYLAIINRLRLSVLRIKEKKDYSFTILDN